MTPAELSARLSQKLAVGDAVSTAGAVFSDRIDIRGAGIAPVDFSGATFSAAVDFSGSRFAGLAWFKGCVFHGPVNFDGVTFGNDARFDDAQFAGTASFSRATFEGTATFDRVDAARAVLLDRIVALGNVSCAQARFRAAFSLRSAECLGGLWLESTRFDERPDFKGCDVHGRTWLRGATITAERDAPARLAHALTAYGYQWT